MTKVFLIIYDHYFFPGHYVKLLLIPKTGKLSIEYEKFGPFLQVDEDPWPKNGFREQFFNVSIHI